MWKAKKIDEQNRDHCKMNICTSENRNVGADVTVGPYNFYALFYGEVYLQRFLFRLQFHNKW